MITRAKFLAKQARNSERYYQNSTIGYNYQMSNIVAGIGLGQMLHINEHIEKKQSIYKQYQRVFADIPEISMNPMNENGVANNWLSCMTIEHGCCWI